MQDEIKDNGWPAFPVTAGQQVYATGMTLRDWFAGQALASLAGQYGQDMLQDVCELGEGSEWAKGLSWAAYDIADAMIAARETGGAA